MALHEDKMGTARAYVLSRSPYLSSIIYGFMPTPLPGIRTMLCTPGMILGYDPAWAESASIEELGADIMHETEHFARRHFWRQGIAHKDLFNIGGDLAINPSLRDGGWKLAKDAIFPGEGSFADLPVGRTTEEYYDLLVQKRQMQPQPSKKPGAGPSGVGLGAGEGEGTDAGAGTEGAHVGAGSCGGIAGNPLDIEKVLEAMPDVVPRTELEVQAIVIRAAKDFRDHMQKQAAAGRGNIPSFMAEFLKVLDEDPVVPWQEELAAISHDCVGTLQSGGDDYSLRRPSKRSYLRGGILRPGLVEYLPEVAFILDTSGSMGHPQLLGVAREVIGIMDALGIDEIWWCEADSSISQNWQRVHIDFFRDLVIHGRGGTDFRPAINSAAELHPRPDLLFYGTDGDGPAPAHPPPGMEVIWVLVPSHWNRAPAPWGHAVFATEDKDQKRAFQKTYAKQVADWNQQNHGQQNDNDDEDDDD